MLSRFGTVHSTVDSILEIPTDPVADGIGKLISWGWEWEWLDGNGGGEKSTFSHFQSEEEKQPVGCATSASPGTSADSDTLDCHSPPAKKRRVFDFTDLCSPDDDRQQSRNERDRICQPEWEWERETKKSFNVD